MENNSPPPNQIQRDAKISKIFFTIAATQALLMILVVLFFRMNRLFLPPLMIEPFPRIIPIFLFYLAFKYKKIISHPPIKQNIAPEKALIEAKKYRRDSLKFFGLFPVFVVLALVFLIAVTNSCIKSGSTGCAASIAYLPLVVLIPGLFTIRPAIKSRAAANEILSSPEQTQHHRKKVVMILFGAFTFLGYFSIITMAVKLLA